jgi:nucleoside-diphosphate-sugar epimerase
MNIIVTGSEGYIGKNLIPILKRCDFNVMGIDRKNGFEASSIHHKFLKYNKIEYIIHLASLSGITACSDDLKQAYLDNVSTTINIFRAAEVENIPVIFASSQAAKTPKANYYALTKYMAECEAEEINKRNQTNIRVLRFTNIYGGIDYLETKNTVISRFVNAKRENKEIVINGDGTQERDFIHVNDICVAIYHTMLWGNTYEPIDIGTGVATSVLQLAKIFDHKFTFHPRSSIIGTSRNVADTENAKKFIAFSSKLKLEEQIRKEYL